MKTLITTILILISFSQADAKWERINGPYGGNIISVSFIDNIVFVGTSMSGVYGYDIEEENFFDLNYEMQNLGGIVKVAKHKDLLYLVSGYDVYVKPLTGGKWSLLELNRTDNYRHMFRDILFIGDTILCATSFGVVFSPDLGATWEYRNEGLIADIFVTYLAMKGDTLLSGVTGSLHYSIDMGMNWIKFDINTSNISTLKVIDNNIYFASVDPSSPYHDGLLKSINGGETWFNIGLKDKIVTDLVVMGDRIFASTRYSGIFVSPYDNQSDTEEPYNWTEINQGLINPNTSSPFKINRLEIVNNKIWAGTEAAGIFELTNATDTWYQLEYIKVPAHTNLVSITENNFYCGTAGNGVYTSQDSGESWNKSNEGLKNESNTSTIAKIISGKLYSTINYESLFNRLYMHNPIEDKWICLTESLSNLIIFDFAVIENRILLSTSSGFYLSENDGQTWFKNESEELKTNIRSVTNIGSTIFICTDSGVFKSLDYGKTFEKTSNTGGSQIISNFDKLYLRANQELFLSTDFGLSWYSILSFKGSDERFQALREYKNIIFVSTYWFNIVMPSDGRVIYTVNDGLEWNDISAGLYNTSWVKDFAFSGDEVLAATYAGVYRAKLSDFGIEVSVAENEIETYNYLYTYPPFPMPARSEVSTRIVFDTSTDIAVENIAVYDIYGRKLPTKESLRFEQETFYSGNIIWDCSAVEPGVYIIRINHGTEVRAVKVMVGI
jgi:photosystem II stability/assembly factor-like uncharacterized protein